MNKLILQYIQLQNKFMHMFIKYPLYLINYIFTITWFIVLFSWLMQYNWHLDAWQRWLISEDLFNTSLQFLDNIMYLLPFIVASWTLYILFDTFAFYDDATD